MIMNKAYVRIIVLALVVLAVVLSGCLDAQLSTKVNRDFSGTRTMHLEMSPVLYTALESNLSRESFSSVNGADLVSYKKDIKDNKVILDITANYKDLRNVNNVRISEHDKILRYEDSTFESLGRTEAISMTGTISIKYTVEMPYKIEDSNADMVEDNKATWVIVGLTDKTLYAESKVPAIPGFTLLGVILMLLIAIKIARK